MNYLRVIRGGEDVYLVLSSGQIGKISYICKCNQCRERMEAELLITDFNNRYLDMIKYHDLFDRKKVLNIGEKLVDLSREHSDEERNRMVADLYQEWFLKSD